jgi:hypothetical protein
MIADLQEQIRRLSSASEYVCFIRGGGYFIYDTDATDLRSSSSSGGLSQENPYRQLVTDLKRENEELRKRLAEIERNCRRRHLRMPC